MFVEIFMFSSLWGLGVFFGWVVWGRRYSELRSQLLMENDPSDQLIAAKNELVLLRKHNAQLQKLIDARNEYT